MAITERIIKWLNPKKTSRKNKFLAIRERINSLILQHPTKLPCLISLSSQLNRIEPHLELSFSPEQEDSFNKMIDAYIELFKNTDSTDFGISCSNE